MVNQVVQQLAQHKFVRFLVVGGLSTIVNYIVFLLCLRLTFFLDWVAVTIGYIAGLIFGFSLNKKWTFSADVEKSYFSKYTVVYLVSLICSVVLFKFLTSVIGIIPEIANIFCIFLTTLTNYFGVKLLVFKQ